MYRKTLRNFDEGLRALQQNTDFATLRDIINEMISICPPEKAHLAKDRIARTMRRKQAYEIQQASNFPDALAAIDKKYMDLATVLRYAEGGGMQISGFGDHSAPQVVSSPQPQAQTPPATSTPAAMAKPMPASMMGMGLKPLMLLNWVKAKKDMLLKGAAIATVAGGTYFVFQKYFGGGEDNKKNPKDKESDFDRTIRSIQKYRAFSRLSKEPDFGSEYFELLDSKKKKGKTKKTSKDRDPSKLDEWEKEEEALMRSMTAAHKALTEKPDTNFKLPKLPAPKENPIPVVSDMVDTTTHSKGKRGRKRKKDLAPVEEFETNDDVVEDVSDSETETDDATPSSSKKKRRRKKNPKSTVEKVSKSDNGRLIPIVKRTKRVRKIS